MDKQYLLNQLDRTLQVYVLGLASATLLLEPDVRPLLTKAKVGFGTYEIALHQLDPLLSDPALSRAAVTEFVKHHFRAFICETFRLIEVYAAASRQSHLFRTARWHNFARVLRNALSHDGKFRLSNHDKGLLPLSWRTHAINATMDGRDVTGEFFSPVDAWNLVSEMRTFVEFGLS